MPKKEQKHNDNGMGDEAVAWAALDAYFASNNYFITKHHLESFDDCFNRMPVMIKTLNPFTIVKPYPKEPNVIKHEIQLFIGGENADRIKFQPSDPELRPNEARIYNKTYSTDIIVDVDVRFIYKPHPTQNPGKDQVEKTKRIENIKLASIPTMLHSAQCMLRDKSRAQLSALGECVYDQGGYFIVDGKEKVIIAQERIEANALFVEKVNSETDKRSFTGHILCKSEDTSVFPKTIHIDIMKGRVDLKSPDKNCPRFIDKDTIQVTIPHITEGRGKGVNAKLHHVPLFVLFRALGVESDGAIMRLLNVKSQREEDFFRASVIQAHELGVFNQFAALDYIAEHVEFKNHEHVLYVLHENLFPQLGNAPLEAKAVMLAEYSKKLVKVAVGLAPPTDRDNFIHKRVDISGYLMADVFKDFYNEFRNATRGIIDKKYEYGGWNDKTTEIDQLITDGSMFDSRIITDRFRKSLKGKWGVEGKDGIVQDLSRVSYMSFVSHLRRLTSTMDSSIKIRRPHQLNTDQFGYCCPSESPDGADIGFIKNFAMLCKVSFNVSSEMAKSAIMRFFKSEFVSVLDMLKRPEFDHHTVHINNIWWGCFPDRVVPDIVKYMRLLRRCGFINAYTSVAWDIKEKTIKILTEGGRPCRPIFIVEKGKLKFQKSKHAKLTWSELVGGGQSLTTFKDPVKALGLTEEPKESITSAAIIKAMSKYEHAAVIEYIDVLETNCSLIAMEPADIRTTTTHCEIHPTTMLSMYTAVIPLANHNSGPRNIFSGAQGKQAIGVYATNFNNRIDTMSYVLHYPQQPLVQTRYAQYLGYNNMPNGENAIVAIMTYTGYNQEDSIIINQGAIDRGLFNLSYFKSLIEEEKDGVHFGNTKDMYLRGEIASLPKAVYDGRINEDGLPIPETYLEEGDPVIGKYKRNVSMVNKDDDESRIFSQVEERVTCEEITEFIDKTTESVVDKVISYKNRDDCQEVKVRLRKFRKPELGDKLACYDADTEVLTSVGWVKWPELTMEHRVASLNSDMHMVYVLPRNVFTYDHEGEMVRICKTESDEVDLLVTPNHNLLLSYNVFSPYVLSRADKNLETTFWVPKTFPLASERKELLHYKGTVYRMSDIVPFLLLTYLTGKVQQSEQQTPILRFDIKCQPHIECIAQMCHMGYIKQAEWQDGVYVIHVNENDISGFVTHSRVEMMNILFTTPSYALQQAFQQLLLSAGDAIISIERKDELQHLLLHANLSSSIKNGVLAIDNKATVRINGKEHCEVVQYKGKVYCAETATGVLCVRRNGVVTWCGNSRHAQKGVIGMIMSEQDMPFNKDGIRPDIIINPHAIPTRMTIAHILECLCGKAAATFGFRCDATPFERQDFKQLYDALEINGLNRHGDEVLYNGRTGEQLRTEVFIGPTYYLRLKHMVADKINFRTTGPRVAMTHQPTQGRANDGGLRIGEMETNCLIAHGIAGFAKESMMERSDGYHALLDPTTGDFNGNKSGVSVHVPFALKLLTQEMQVFGVRPILYTHKENEQAQDDDDYIDDWRSTADPIDEDDE